MTKKVINPDLEKLNETINFVSNRKHARLQLKTNRIVNLNELQLKASGLKSFEELQKVIEEAEELERKKLFKIQRVKELREQQEAEQLRKI